MQEQREQDKIITEELGAKYLKNQETHRRYFYNKKLSQE